MPPPWSLGQGPPGGSCLLPILGAKAAWPSAVLSSAICTGIPTVPTVLQRQPKFGHMYSATCYLYYGVLDSFDFQSTIPRSPASRTCALHTISRSRELFIHQPASSTRVIARVIHHTPRQPASASLINTGQRQLSRNASPSHLLYLNARHSEPHSGPHPPGYRLQSSLSSRQLLGFPRFLDEAIVSDLKSLSAPSYHGFTGRSSFPYVPPYLLPYHVARHEVGLSPSSELSASAKLGTSCLWRRKILPPTRPGSKTSKFHPLF